MGQTLKEKLESLRQKNLETPAEQAEPAQCDCGSALAGECAECQPEQGDVLDRLRSLGGQHGVNPPPPAETDVQVPQTAAPVADEGKTICPYCNGSYKSLARHTKCKAQPEDGLKPAAEHQRLVALSQAAPEAAEPPPPAQDTPAEPPARTRPTAPQDAPGFFIALVDCLPLRDGDPDAEMLVFDEVAGPLAAAVARTNSVPHWKMVDYAKGGGELARLFEDWLREHEPRGFLLCSTGSIEFQVCRSVVQRYARNVIVGVR